MQFEVGNVVPTNSNNIGVDPSLIDRRLGVDQLGQRPSTLVPDLFQELLKSLDNFGNTEKLMEIEKREPSQEWIVNFLKGLTKNSLVGNSMNSGGDSGPAFPLTEGIGASGAAGVGASGQQSVGVQMPPMWSADP